MIHSDGDGLAAFFFFFFLVGREGVDNKLEVHVVLALVCNQVGMGVGQFYASHMDITLDNVFHDGADPELLNAKQIGIL